MVYKSEMSAGLANVEGRRQDLPEPAGDLQQERDTLQAILEGTHVLLAYLDPQFNLVRVNPAYARSMGHPEAGLVGHNHFDLFPKPPAAGSRLTAPRPVPGWEFR